MQLLKNDTEGRLIQTSGVDTVVYRQDLWWDKKAQLALMQMGNLDAEMVWHQVAGLSVPSLMRPLRDLSPEEISRFFEAEKLEQALALARVASPPSVAAEAPPQVVSNGTNVGDVPQHADATIRTYGGDDLADINDWCVVRR